MSFKFGNIASPLCSFCYLKVERLHIICSTNSVTQLFCDIVQRVIFLFPFNYLLVILFVLFVCLFVLLLLLLLLLLFLILYHLHFCLKENFTLVYPDQLFFWKRLEIVFWNYSFIASCVNIEYQFFDNFQAVCESPDAACVLKNICNR